MMSNGSKEALTVLIVTHVKGVERSLNSSNCYSCYSCRKGRKITLCTQYRYIQCYVERVERLCYVEAKDIHILANNFLNIQVIFNPKKSFEKLTLRPFQPYHPMQCMSKHVKGVKSRNNFQPFQHTWHWMVWLERSKSQLSKTFFQIENRLNIKKVMSKNVFVPCFNVT